MKKFKILIIMLGFVSLSYGSVGTVTDTILKKTTILVDSTTKSIKNGLNTIDTSSLSKQVYSDFKSALTGIAAALKVGVEHVYIVLVKQQVVKAVQWIILGLIPTLLLLIFGKSIWHWSNVYYEQSDGFSAFLATCFYIFNFIGLGLFIFHINTIVTGLINPEYGAMLDIMDFVKAIHGQ